MKSSRFGDIKQGRIEGKHENNQVHEGHALLMKNFIKMPQLSNLKVIMTLLHLQKM